jgi:hypothetical protein
MTAFQAFYPVAATVRLCPCSALKLEMTNEGIGSPDREPQSPSHSISQVVSVAHPYPFAIGYWLSAIAFEPLARMPPV